MTGFNDLVAKASEIATKAAEAAMDLAGTAAAKTKQISHIAKLNVDISTKKEEIKKAYEELGKLYYEAHRTAEENCAELCLQIDDAKKAIAAMEEEIARLKAEEEPQDPDLESVVDATEAEAEGKTGMAEKPAEKQNAPGQAETGKPEDTKPQTEEGEEKSPEPDQSCSSSQESSENP